MIKNFFYSLFLHSLLLIAVYASFNLKKIDDTKEVELRISFLNEPEEANLKITKQNSEKINESLEPPKKENIVEEQKKDEKVKNPKPIDKTVSKATQTKPLKEPTPKKKAKNIADTKKIEPQPQKEKITETKEKYQEEPQKEVASAKTQSPEISDAIEDVANEELSVREKFNIQSQLKLCYHRASQENKPSNKTKIVIEIEINKEGKIETNVDDLINYELYDDPAEKDYRIVIDNIRRAIDLCSPIRNLPQEKYDIWKEVILEFE